jgi:polysaccharide transporter, PST family
LTRLRNHTHLLSDIASIYGVQFATYVIPLITVPYLARVLGPASWGLMAMAQAFAMYGGLAVEYGFVYSATRQIATASTQSEIESVVAGVSGAKFLLAVTVAVAACAAYLFVPLFHEHPLLLWTAVLAEILKASLPSYYFFGMKRVAIASTLDIAARIAAAAGLFFFVRGPADAWKVFGLQALGAIVAFFAGHAMIYRRHTLRFPQISHALSTLKQGGAMFLFRSAHNVYTLSNAFILGLFAPTQAVGYYAGAEKINSAAMGLLSPLSTALYPRAAGLVKNSLGKAARLTRLSLYVMCGVSVVLGLVMWFGSPLIVRIVLGHDFFPSGSVLKILSLRAPMVAWTNVLGFQWLLALALEKSFQRITVVALLLNILIATCLAPIYTFNGMAWAVVLSQAAAALGIYFLLRRRKLNPIVMASDPTYA